MADLKRRSARGGAITVAAQVAKFLLNFGTTAVLARMLTPGDFGLVAMIAAFTGFISLFKDLGLSAATVQRAEVSHAQVNALFWLNVLLSLALMLFTALLAPAIAWFYGEPRVTAVVFVTASTFVLGGLTAQHTALLRRQMRFGALAAVELTTIVAGTAAGIILACYGAGYWSLIGIGVVGAVTNAVAVWALSPWRPGVPRWDDEVWPMLRFGGNLTGFNVTNYLTRNLDNVLIGWYWGAGPLGLYAKAYNLLLMPVRQVNAPISAVALPALSRLQDAPDRFRRVYLKATQAIAALGMPLVVCTFVVADDLILMVMGAQWIDAIPIYRVLAVVAFIDTAAVSIGWAYVALGRADRQFRWQIFESAVTAAGFLVGLRWGAIGVATGFCVARCALRYPALAYCLRGTPITVGDYRAAIWRPATASVLAGIAVLLTASPALASASMVGRFAACVLLYGMCYVLFWLLLPGGRAVLRELAQTLDEFKPGRRLGRSADPVAVS